MSNTNQLSEKGRRLQVVEIAGENIEKFFTGEMTIIEGLPDDAALYKFWEEPARDVYCFAFESEEFPVLNEGEKIPVVDISVVQRRVNNSTHWVCPNCFDTHTNGDIIKE